MAIVAVLAGLVVALVFRPGSAQTGGEPAGEPESDHEITVVSEDRARVGDTRVLALSIAPRPDATISRDGPLVIDLEVTPRQGLILPRRRYEHRHAVDPQAAALHFELAYRAERAGRYTVTASLRFWVCSKRTCRPVRASRRVQVEITE